MLGKFKGFDIEAVTYWHDTSPMEYSLFINWDHVTLKPFWSTNLAIGHIYDPFRYKRMPALYINPVISGKMLIHDCYGGWIGVGCQLASADQYYEINCDFTSTEDWTDTPVDRYYAYNKVSKKKFGEEFSFNVSIKELVGSMNLELPYVHINRIGIFCDVEPFGCCDIKVRELAISMNGD